MAETVSVGILAVGFGKLNWEEAAKGAAVPCHQRVAAEIPQGHLLCCWSQRAGHMASESPDVP